MSQTRTGQRVLCFEVECEECDAECGEYLIACKELRENNLELTGSVELDVIVA
jgi:hypothetical protein